MIKYFVSYNARDEQGFDITGCTSITTSKPIVDMDSITRIKKTIEEQHGKTDVVPIYWRRFEDAPVVEMEDTQR